MSLTGGFYLYCGVDIGGIKKILLVNPDDISAMAIDPYGVYGVFILKAFKKAYQIDFEKASFTPNSDNSTVLSIDLGKLSQDSRDFIQSVRDCGKCGVVAVVTDANDTMWVLGYDEKDGAKNPLIIENSSGNTAARGEDTENVINFIRLKPKLEEERTTSQEL